jgi:D-methionine transport system ATP-binding protein
MSVIRDVHENLHPTIVIATQDIEIIKTFCHRAAVLHQGEIVETATVVDLFTQPKADISKEFVKSATRSEMPMALRRRLRSESKEKTNPVLRLSFLGPTAKEPIIAELIQQFGLTLNIIQAHLETISDKAVGIMILELIGKREYIEKALLFLESKGLNVEVLGYV